MRLFGGEHFRSSLRHFLLGRASQAILALLLTLLTIRVMSPVDYGVFLVLVGLTDLLRPLSSLGVLPTVQQFLPEMALHASMAQLRRFVRITRWVRWALLAALVGFLFVLWECVIAFAGIASVSGLTALLVCGMICVILALEYSEATLEALLDQRSAQSARLLHLLLRLGGVVVLGFTGLMSVDRLLACEAGAALCALVLSEWRLSQKIAQLQPDGSKIFTRQEIIGFGMHLSVTQILNTLATPGVLRILVARQLGIEVAGQFGFMQTLLQQLNKLMPSLLLANLVSPMLIAARARGQTEKLAAACGFLFKTNVLLVWPIVPAMFFIGNELMSLVSGGRLVALGNAMTMLIFALSALTQLQVAATILRVHRMSGALAWTGGLSLLAPAFVFVGAGYSLMLTCVGLFAASAIRYLITMFIIQSSVARVRLDSRGSVRYLIALALAFAIALPIQSFSSWVALAVFLVVALVFMPLVRPVSLGESIVFREALRRNMPLARWLVSKHQD